MYVKTLPCDDIDGVLHHCGYRMEIVERDGSKDVLLHYPSYCINKPHWLRTYSYEWTNEEIRRDIEGAVLRFLRGQGYHVYRLTSTTPME